MQRVAREVEGFPSGKSLIDQFFKIENKFKCPATCDTLLTSLPLKQTNHMRPITLHLDSPWCHLFPVFQKFFQPGLSSLSFRVFSSVADFILHLHSFGYFNNIFVRRKKNLWAQITALKMSLVVFLADFVLHILKLIIIIFLIRRRRCGMDFFMAKSPQP